MDSHDIENYFVSHRNTLAVLLIIVGIASVSGFFMGMRQSKNDETWQSSWLAADDASVEEQAIYPEAPLYKDIPTTKWKANAPSVRSGVVHGPSSQAYAWIV